MRAVRCSFDNNVLSFINMSGSDCFMKYSQLPNAILAQKIGER